MSGQTKSLDALTGLRFLAAFAVFIHHVSGKFGISHIAWPLGAQAVSFFFVLSGFILTYVYHDRLTTKTVKKFYFTRWARIWPLHIVCLGLAIGLAGWQYSANKPDFFAQLITCSLLVQSWVPNTDWAFAINGVSWSISTEAFFYLMFPVFLLGGQKQFWMKYVGLLTGMILLVTGISALSHTSLVGDVDYYRMGHTNPLLRLPEFCTGMAIGFIYLNRAKSETPVIGRWLWLDTVLELLCFGLIFGYQYAFRQLQVVAHLYNAQWGGPFLASFFNFTSGCLAFAVVIYVFSKSRGLFSQILSTRGMVFLGEVSFAFYMVHQLVIRSTLTYSRFYEGLSPWMIAACIGAIALALSIVLFKLVEMPCKSALIALYERDFKKSIQVPAKAVWKFSTSSLCAVVAVLVLVPMFTLADHRVKQVTSSDVQKILVSTSKDLRNIRFGQSVVLLGYQVHPKAGGLEIQFAWQMNSTSDYGRFIHICDRDGKVVGHGPREDEMFKNAKLGSRFVDTVYLVDDALKDGCSIGVGFHKKGVGMPIVNKGPRSLGNRRLDLVTPKDFEQLASAREEKFGVRVSRTEDNVNR